MKTVEKFERSQIGFLHDVLGVKAVARHPTREIVGRVEVRQKRLFKFLGSFLFEQLLLSRTLTISPTLLRPGSRLFYSRRGIITFLGNFLEPRRVSVCEDGKRRLIHALIVF